MQLSRTVILISLLVAACGGPQSDPSSDNGGGSVANASREADPWYEEFYNYMPADDDLVIEGPCGSSFVFRQVTTYTVEDWLASETVFLGQANESAGSSEYALLEGIRREAIVGPFTEDDNPAERHYYIGKYEVTQDQYDAVLGDTCPKPTPEGSLPVSGLSFFDTQRFMVGLNEWIYANPDATATLPHADSIPAVVRLPSEAEWEFAARGGQAVTVEDRLAPIYPMDDTENRYEWYNGDDSCRDSLRPVGYLLPNPLGIHDMLGNVREIVQDPFELTAGWSNQGQTGAMMTKGGACDTSLEDLRSSARREYILYSYEEASLNRPAMVGFRLALGAPAVTSNRRLESYNSAYSSLRAPRSSQFGGGADPATDLRGLAEETQDVGLKEELSRIAAVIDAEIVERNTFELENAKAIIATTASLIRNYRFANRDADSAEQAMNTPNLPASNRATIQRRFESASIARDTSRDFYVQSLVRAADFSPELFRQAALRVSEEYKQTVASEPGNLTVSEMMCLFATQVEHYRQYRPGDFEMYFDEIVTTSTGNSPGCPRG